MAALPITPTPDSGWSASLALGFCRRGDATALCSRKHVGPLRVQRPFHPEGPGVCHVYLLHPPGGLVAGDGLTIDVALGADAKALITTPAAGKVYRSGDSQRTASQMIRMVVAPGATLEWVPQETIAFAGARARLNTRVDLAPGAAFIGWDILCLGRPANHEAFATGHIRQRFELWRDGRPLVLERLTVAGSDEATSIVESAAGLRGLPTTGTMMAVPARDENLGALVDAVRQATNADSRDLRSVTVLHGVVVCRYLGSSGERARQFFIHAWHTLRPLCIGVPAHPPRIWAT